MLSSDRMFLLGNWLLSQSWWLWLVWSAAIAFALAGERWLLAWILCGVLSIAVWLCAIAAAHHIRSAWLWLRDITRDMPIRGNPRLGRAIFAMIATWLSLLAAGGFFTYYLPKAIARVLASP